MKDTTYILIVDDDEEDFMITRDIINDIPNRKYKIDWISDYNEALKIISSNKYDIYLIDYRLGAHTGLELIEEAIKQGCLSPLILLTGQGGMKIDELAMQAGASDYLVKGTLNPFYLERSMRYSMEHAKNIAQIKNLNSELERRVEERTTELNEAIKKLEQIIYKERELNALKSRFVTMASHEFRTPLSTILSSASLISKYNKEEETEKRLKHINRIKSSVNNLTGILNDFLSLSKLEEGKIENNPSIVNITNLSDEIKEEMEALTKEEQIIVNSHTGKEEVYLDKQMLKNILINLVSNAIKYSPEGSEIFYTTNVNDSELIITVKDQGMGISDEDKKHLFSRFFRGQNAINIQGTGLGLNIVKRYIDLMQGNISLESTLNKGTTFKITLPIN